MMGTLFMSRVYDSLDWIFWAVLLLVAGWSWCRFRLNRRLPGPLTALVVALPSLVVVLIGLRLAWVAPLAIIQDIVAAQQALKGEPLPTTGIQPLVKQALAEEHPPASLEAVWPWLASAWPDLVKQEQQEYDKIPDLIEVQAHPPFATLFVIPFVYALGVHGTSLAISLVSVACALVTLSLLCRGLKLNLSGSQKVLYCSALLGWYPMFLVLSHGQWGALLGMLAVVGWYNILRGRPLFAGFAIGLAASLKVFPGLLLIYFLLRHRRAFWAGVATVLALNVASMAVFGAQSYVDYMHTARFVAGNWVDTRQNWSLFAAVRHVSDIVGIPALSSRASLMGFAILLMSAIALLVLANRKSGPRTDFEYSLFVIAMTWISPTCWSHYFVVLSLPLAVLANRAMRGSGTSSLVFLGLFLVLALPDHYSADLIPSVAHQLGTRAGIAMLLLPSLALFGAMIWLAALARTSTDGCHGPD
jgi:hypothetical protein